MFSHQSADLEGAFQLLVGGLDEVAADASLGFPGFVPLAEPDAVGGEGVVGVEVGITEGGSAVVG